MRTQVQKWGNSLAVRIPKAFAASLGIEDNTTVELAMEEGSLVVRPAPTRVYELRLLLDQVSEANLHGEADWGEATGREEW